MAHLDAYLFFDGNCAEAMRFYEHVFRGRLELLQTYADSPAAADIARDFERLLGRDEELDRLFLAGASPGSADFVRAVTRAAVRIGAVAANRVILGELS